MKLNMFQICAELPEGAAPEWIMLVPAGLVDTVSLGQFICDQVAMDRTIAACAALGRDLVLDWEHQTLGGKFSAPDGRAPAAGWIKQLAARDNGLWGRVEWTADAAESVGKREYRYVSPVLLVDPGDKRLSGFHSVALTNTPQIKGLESLVAKDISREDPMKDRLIQQLKLAATATDEEVLAAVQAALQFRADTCTSLALSDRATPADARGAILVLKAAPQSMVPQAEFLALKQRLDDRDAGDLVNQALNEGKLAPASADWARDYARKDPEGFKVFVAKAPVVVPGGRISDVAGRNAGTGAATENEALVCKQLGLTPEKFRQLGGEA